MPNFYWRLIKKRSQKKTDLGIKIENLISKGEFVSDEIVNELLKKKISSLTDRNKIIFDGYPRTISQSEELIKIMEDFHQKIDCVISLNVPREIIQKRIAGRVTCEKCNITLNEYFDKEKINSLSCKGAHLIKRKDDNLETILNRYDKYISTTKPVLDFLSNSLSIEEVDGTLKIEEIFDKINNIIRV